MNMSEEMAPPDWGGLRIVDSDNARRTLQKLEGPKDAFTHREWVRQIYSGLGKSTISRWLKAVNLRKNTPPSPTTVKHQNILESLRPTIQRWASRPPWSPKHADMNGSRWTLKVKSHQLTDAGNLKQPRTPKDDHHASPCYALTILNWYPDRLCTEGIKKMENTTHKAPPTYPKAKEMPIQDLIGELQNLSIVDPDRPPPQGP